MINVGMFTTVYHRESEVKAAMESWLQTNVAGTAGIPPVKLSWWVCFNGGEQSLLRYTSDYVDRLRGKYGVATLLKSAKNIGKAAAINSMVEEALGFGTDYIVSIDSDMVLQDPDWLLKFIDIYKASQGAANIKLGGLAPNQTGNSCHILTESTITYRVGEYTLTTRINNEGVAGGVLFSPKEIWEKVKGYRAHQLFGGEDGFFTYDVWNAGYLLPVVKEIAFWHPPVSDRGYQDWKHRAARNQLKSEEISGYYEYQNSQKGKEHV